MSVPPAQRSFKAHFIGIASLFAAFFLICAGTPGARGLNRDTLVGEGREAVERRAGVFAPVVLAVYQANFDIRVPISKYLVKPQSLFRISQAWGLYGAGPKNVKWLRIDVDGVPIYRSEDPDLTWRNPQFTHRKMRPMVETMASKADAYNWTGFSRWVLHEVHRDFPDAQSISIVAERSERKPGAKIEERHRRVAAAPDWTWQSYNAAGKPVDLADGDNP